MDDGDHAMAGHGRGVPPRPTPAPSFDPFSAGDRLRTEHPAGDPFADAVRGTRMAMAVSDPRLPDTPLVFVNDSFLKLTGYPRDEVLGRNCRFLQGPETDPTARARIHAALDAGESIEIDLLNYRRDGTTFWNALYVSPVRDASGETIYFFASQVDVTARKEAERSLIEARDRLEAAVEARTADLREALEQKTLLLHEVDHRVKNNLQLISTLITLQSRRIADASVRASLKDMLERVTALAAVHRQLYQAEDVTSFDVSAFLGELAADLHAASGREDICLELDLSHAEIAADRAAPVALLVNELLTNAIKHAFPDGRAGRLRVGSRLDGGRIHVVIEDDGVGSSGEAEGFGTTVIRTLARQLRAELTIEDARPGVRTGIEFPAEVARPRAQAAE